MISLATLGMIDKNTKSFPNVQAHAVIPNGWLGTIAAGKTVANTADTVKSAGLMIAMNTQVGDDVYVDGVKIAKDAYVNMFLLSQWAYQQLKATAASFADGISAIAAGDKLVADANGLLDEVSDVSGYGVYFVVDSVKSGVVTMTITVA